MNKDKKDYDEYIREQERLSRAVHQLKEKSNAIKQAPNRMHACNCRTERLGKSTLLKKLVSFDPELHVVGAAKLGYFSQHQDNLIGSTSILDNIRSESRYSETFIRTVLSRLAFKREDVHKRVEDLSGGERMRASLAKVFLGDHNVLVLDEPTNYLDLQTKESLIELMKAYPGTIVIVSHDRSMVDDIATHVLSMGDEEPRCEWSINDRTRSRLAAVTTERMNG